MGISREQQGLREMYRILAERASPDPDRQAARARQALAEASPAAARIITLTAKKSARRSDPDRWTRADAAAEYVLAASPTAQEPAEIEVDPVQVRREESMARALRRARLERRQRKEDPAHEEPGGLRIQHTK